MYTEHFLWVGPWGMRWFHLSAFRELTDKQCGLESGLTKKWLLEVLPQGLSDHDPFLSGLNTCPWAHLNNLAKEKALSCSFLGSEHPRWSAGPDSYHLQYCVGNGSRNSVSRESTLTRQGGKRLLSVCDTPSQRALASPRGEPNGCPVACSNSLG